MRILGFGKDCLTEADIERITDKAAEKAVIKITAHVYQEVGKGVVQKLFWIIGSIAVSFATWLHIKN